MRRCLPSLIALLSGMCALVYEVIWMRTFVPVFGLSVYSTTAVLVAFMGGLGLGSLVAPWLLRRWLGSVWSLYALLELGIGAGACVIPFCAGPVSSLFVALAPADQPVAITLIIRLGLSAVTMILPTTLMGITLPALIVGAERLGGAPGASARRIGLLYGLNTVGAAAGCVLVGFVMLYAFGIRGATFVTAAGNLLLATSVYLLFVRPGHGRPTGEGSATATDATRCAAMSPRLSARAILGLYLLVGFAAFGFEVIWLRILVFYLQSATYSFSIMLAVYLAGVGLGSLFYARLVERRLDGSSWTDTARALVLAQIGIAVCGIATLRVCSALPTLWGVLISVLGAQSWGVIAGQKALVAASLIFPATFLMGLSFPLVARLYKGHGAADAGAVGHLYAANTAGSILGSFFTGFVLLDWLGVQTTLGIMAGVSLFVAACFSLGTRQAPRFRLVAATGTLFFALIFATNPPRLLVHNFEKYLGKVLYYRETAADISLAFEVAPGARYLAFHDGRGTSGTTLQGNHVNRFLAYSTMLIKPDAKDVLVISMGCGNTASAYSKFPIERLDIVDISPGPFEAARYFPTNQNVLDDPRVHLHVEDGRNFLLRSARRYDIIELELPSIHTEGIVNLYTSEFYGIAKTALKDGGVLSQWIDAAQAEKAAAYMLTNTMVQKFPNATMWVNGWSWTVNGVKTDTEVTIDYTKVAPLFAAPEVVADMQSVQTNLVDILSRLTASGGLLRDAVAGSAIITDDNTLVDFMVPKLHSPYAFGGGVAYFTAPMRYAFQQEWEKQGLSQAGAWTEMFPFFAEPFQRQRVDRSVQQTLIGFPAEILAAIDAANDDWTRMPPGAR